MNRYCVRPNSGRIEGGEVVEVSGTGASLRTLKTLDAKKQLSPFTAHEGGAAAGSKM